MSPESKFGMVLGLICLVAFAVINAGPKTFSIKSPTPEQAAVRINVGVPDV